MTAAVTAIRPSLANLEPYRPPPGIPAKQAIDLANAHHENRFKKLLDQANGYHKTLIETKRAVAEQAVENGVTKKAIAIETLNGILVGAASMSLGIVDTRFGGEHGHAVLAGLPVDGIVAVAGLGGAAIAAVSGQKVLGHALRSVGYAGLHTMAYRAGAEIGTTLLEKSQQKAAGAATAANGTRPGTVYSVPVPHTPVPHTRGT